MLTKDDKKVLKDIEHWQRKRFKAGALAGIADMAFFPVDIISDIVIRDSFIDKAVKPVMGFIKKLQDSSGRFVNTQDIIKKARKAGLQVTSLKDLKGVPIAYLDVMAKSFYRKNKLYAALQGASLSVGSYVLSFVDFPALFAMNLKMIFQVGACYGYQPKSAREKDFALHVFCIASSTGSEWDKEYKEMDQLIKSFMNGNLSANGQRKANNEGTHGFITRAVRKITKRWIHRRLPVVGFFLGPGLNYLYTKEVAKHAFMFYRKRFLLERERVRLVKR